MTSEIRLWQVGQDGRLRQVIEARLDLETRLEEWLEHDITVLSDNLLLIGRQVETQFGGYIDLLCLDGNGDPVIVELKKDRTPREITAQVLDYASWVKDLSNDDITRLADGYLKPKGFNSLADAFLQTFGLELPDVLNQSHRMLVVASRVDPASERIISYLSDSYGVDINAVTFQYFRDGPAGELLARTFLIEPEQVEYKSQTRGGSKRRRSLRLEELAAMAEEQGLGRFYNRLVTALETHFQKTTTASALSLYGQFDDVQKVVMTLIPTESSAESGLRFHFYKYRFAQFFQTDVETVVAQLPETIIEWKYVASESGEWDGYDGFFKTDAEVTRFAQWVEGRRKMNRPGLPGTG
jgi:hypothetical protein